MKIFTAVGLFGALFAMSLLSADTRPADKQTTPMSTAARQRWSYVKVDPHTKTKLVVLQAASFEKTEDPYLFKLQEVTGSLYQRHSGSYSDIHWPTAFLDERSGNLIAGRDLTLTKLP